MPLNADAIDQLTLRVYLVLNMLGVYERGWQGNRPVLQEGRAFAREALR